MNGKILRDRLKEISKEERQTKAAEAEPFVIDYSLLPPPQEDAPPPLGGVAAVEPPAERVGITDHAIIRYLERVHNLDIEKIKAEMVPPNIEKMILKCQTAKVPIQKGVRLIVKDCVVITVYKEGEDPKRATLKNRKAMLKSSSPIEGNE